MNSNKLTSIDERLQALEDRVNGIPEGEIWEILLRLREAHGLPTPPPGWSGRQVAQEVFRLMRLEMENKETST